MRNGILILVTWVAASGCARLHLNGLPRDAALAGEWIDVRHATADDTSLWVLRADGYDGTAHIIREADGSETRRDTRYARWYVAGASSDPANRAICFAKRLGRDGATCLGYSLDTVPSARGPVRRLTVRGYEGQHTTADRVLIERKP